MTRVWSTKQGSWAWCSLTCILDRYFCFNKYIHTNKNNLIFPFPLPNKKIKKRRRRWVKESMPVSVRESEQTSKQIVVYKKLGRPLGDLSNLVYFLSCLLLMVHLAQCRANVQELAQLWCLSFTDPYGYHFLKHGILKLTN